MAILIIEETKALAADFHFLQPHLLLRMAPIGEVISTAITLNLGQGVWRHLNQLGYPINGKCCVAAASAGDLETLTRLHEAGCEWDASTPTAATENRNKACLRYALERGCTTGSNITKTAASTGDVELLRILNDYNCKPNKEAIYAAAENGSVECLQFIVEMGVQYSEKVLSLAALNGHIECLHYLQEIQMSTDGAGS
eukprot:gene15479-17700_t